MSYCTDLFIETKKIILNSQKEFNSHMIDLVHQLIWPILYCSSIWPTWYHVKTLYKKQIHQAILVNYEIFTGNCHLSNFKFKAVWKIWDQGSTWSFEPLTSAILVRYTYQLSSEATFWGWCQRYYFSVKGVWNNVNCIKYNIWDREYIRIVIMIIVEFK